MIGKFSNVLNIKNFIFFSSIDKIFDFYFSFKLSFEITKE